VRGDDPEVAAKLRIEERELDAGGRTKPSAVPRRALTARGRPACGRVFLCDLRLDTR
jgi:hypothetical protein